jgi:excisionase family DNA binding protein
MHRASLSRSSAACSAYTSVGQTRHSTLTRATALDVAVRREDTSHHPYRTPWLRQAARAERIGSQLLEEVKKLLQAYTVEQVAEMLHVGRDKVYYLLRTGQLRSIKIGKLRRITEQHLAAFIESREDVADVS